MTYFMKFQNYWNLIVFTTKNNHRGGRLEVPWSSVLVHVSQLSGFRVRWVWRIGPVLVHVSQIWWSSAFWKDVCVRVSCAACFAFINSTLNRIMKSSQIGIRCSGTRKCSQRYEIDHFCQGNISAIQSFEILSGSSRGISVLPLPRPIYRWDQAEVWEEFGIGGWCVVSCTSRQILKFMVPP